MMTRRNADRLSSFKDAFDGPALSIFIWEDGANFDRTMNDYMSAQFPAGIDASNPFMVRRRLSVFGNLTTLGGLFAGNDSVS